MDNDTLPLENVKAGDVLCVMPTRDRNYLTTVDRVTPTGRVVTKAGEFNPKGDKRGESGGWHYTRARVATADDIAGINRASLVDKLRRFPWDKLGADDLKRVGEIVAASKVEPAR